MIVAPERTPTELISVRRDALTGPVAAHRRDLLDQVVALIVGYVRDAADGVDAAGLWTAALGHVPLMATVRSAREVGRALEPPSPATLACLLTDEVLDALGGPATADVRERLAGIIEPIAAGMASAPDDISGTANLVILDVRESEYQPSGGVDALLTQVVATLHGGAPPASANSGPVTSWSVDVQVTVNRLDADTLDSRPEIATRWQDLVKGLDAQAVESLPHFHRIDVPADTGSRGA